MAQEKQSVHMVAVPSLRQAYEAIEATQVLRMIQQGFEQQAVTAAAAAAQQQQLISRNGETSSTMRGFDNIETLSGGEDQEL